MARHRLNYKLFKKRDGNYYFERKDLFTNLLIKKDFEARYACLCPLCSAKYEELIKKDTAKLNQLFNQIVSIDDENQLLDKSEFELDLNGEKLSLRFVEDHLANLWANLKANS